MQKSQKRLGRGLSALISKTDDSATALQTEPQEGSPIASAIKIDRIRPNPYQPRQDITPQQLISLADSIKKTGVIQPITVRSAGDNLYEIIVGERRWRASQMAGVEEIPAMVRDVSNEEMLEFALVENIFREDLNAIDRALAYQRYCNEFELSADDVANKLGEDRTTVTNYLRLLDLPSEVKDLVVQGKLSMGHARCLLAIKSPTDLIHAAKEAINKDLSVRALEMLVRQKVNSRNAASKSAEKSAGQKRPQIRNLEESFTKTLGTKVEINESRRKNAGKITIHYASLDDFDRITNKLGIVTEK